MAEHLDHGSRECPGIHGEYAQEDETEVADAGVGNKPLEVGLHEGHHPAVEDSSHGEPHGHGRKLLCRLGEQRDHEADEAVTARLQEETRKHHASRRGSCGMSVGKPCVQGKSGQLHGKRGKEPEHEKHPGKGRELGAKELGVVEGVHPGGYSVDHDQPDYSGKHQKAADLGEEEELDGRVVASLMAPQVDEEVHRDEHQLPEECEKKHVQGEEDPVYSRQDKREIDVKERDPVLDPLP